MNQSNTTDSKQELARCPLDHYVSAGLRVNKTDPKIICLDCGLTLAATDWVTLYERWHSRPRASVPAVPNHALVQLLNSALIHPNAAEGNIRQVIEILDAAASSSPPAEPPKYDLDPLEFWCDLAEVLGHPRPTKADVPALVSEVKDRLAATPPDTPVVAREAARNAAREWLRGERAAFYATVKIQPPPVVMPQMQKREDDAVEQLAAIITRHLAGTPPAPHFVDAFEDAAKKAHIGFRHNAAWTACDWIECSERRAMIEQLRAATPSPETPVGGEVQLHDEMERNAMIETIAEQEKEIDAAWLAIERGWEIEPRGYFEEQAPKNGFGSPLAMAVHYMWKREIKPTAPVVSDGDDEGEVAKLRQAIGWICDAADAAYIEDADNTRIHEIFNIAAQAAGLTRRLPDEHGRFDETSIG